MTKNVLIIGGGLAGLATATALVDLDADIILLESRPRLGGRASSFQDVASGQMVDTCQHVSMGCCTNFAHFCRVVGVSHLMHKQKCLYFMTPDRRISPFTSDAWPAPFHLARSFATMHYLTLLEKARIAWGLLCLQRASETEDPPLIPWLLAHRQTQRTIDRFWGLVLISALNEEPERMGLRYARKVFLDGFMSHRNGFDVELPSVPLGRLYGDELLKWFDNHGIKLRLSCGAKEIQFHANRAIGVELREGENLCADTIISTVPFDRLLTLLPDHLIKSTDYFRNIRNLESSPITSLHCWYRQPVTPLPHVVLIDSIGQWVFNRGEVAPGEHYLQVVVSAARQFREMDHVEIQQRLTDELAQLFPAATPDALLRARVITEHRATFSAVPGVDQWRPDQQSPIPNFFLAGDWTQTGWPATMEGAVRSGYLAAERVCAQWGMKRRLIQPDL